jgi:hypothetical protein
VTRKAGNAVKPTVILSNDGNKWKMELKSTFKNSEVNWVDGVEFDEGFFYFIKKL